MLTLTDLRGRAVEETNGVFALASELPWIVEGDFAELEALRAALPRRVVRRVGRVLELKFGTAVGDLDLPGLGRVRLRSGKWGEAEFEALLADVSERSAELPFSPGEGGGLPYDRSVVRERRVLLHAFVYLRHVLSSAAPPAHRLLPALACVVRDPHRSFVRDRHQVDVGLASRVDARTLERVVNGADGFIDFAHGGGHLSRVLGGRLPVRVDEPRVTPTVDVPENRFVKAFLEQIDAILTAVEEVASGTKWCHSRLRTQAREMRSVLEPVRRNGLWDEVGQMQRFPAESMVLHRRRGYRETLCHFVRLRRSSRIALDETWERLLELKDVATLYELWCFFEVLRELERILGAPVSADAPTLGPLRATLPYDLRVAWKGGVELFYNHRFSCGRTTPRRSYSTPMRPDVALWIPGQGYHLLDAKFRFDLKQFEDAEREDARDAKRSDLHQMHAYRDAIETAQSAWVLYPGTEARRFLIAVAAPGEIALSGVGAIPCVPGKHCSMLRELLIDLGLGSA